MAETGDTRTVILNIAGQLLAMGGMQAVTFDAIARRLGKSKQAVLYWFPTKHDLLAAMYLPALAGEAEAVRQALLDTSGRSAAISAFVRALAGFHLGDLARFRMMYLAPQMLPDRGSASEGTALLTQVHSVTDGLYGALADHLGGADQPSARREAVAIHAAVLGQLLMLALADALADPMKHAESDLMTALIDSLCGDAGETE